MSNGTRKARAFAVQFDSEAAHVVVGLGDDGRAEGVCLEHVGAGSEVGTVDVANDIGSGEDEEVVVAPHILVPAGEALAPEGGLIEAQLLDLGRHRPIEDEDPLAQRPA